MDTKRRQHILPESYLKHWIDPATVARNKTPMVWVISKDAKRKELKPLGSGHFWREYFYDMLSTSGKRRQNLEDLLGKIEGGMVHVIDKRIVHKQPLDQAEKELVDLFVACMFMRTERIKESINCMVSAKTHIEKAHDETHEKIICDASIISHNAHAHAIYDGILFISEELAKMSHNVFVAPAGKAYLTSDTPCIWLAPLGFAGLANPLIEITLPLTSDHMLQISKTIPTSEYPEATDYMVDQANWEMVRRCRNYFVANSAVLEVSWLEPVLNFCRTR